MSGYDCDYLGVGSGFGGAVSALRLVEKGHWVIVLGAVDRPEADRRRAAGACELAWQPELGDARGSSGSGSSDTSGCRSARAGSEAAAWCSAARGSSPKRACTATSVAGT